MSCEEVLLQLTDILDFHKSQQDILTYPADGLYCTAFCVHCIELLQVPGSRLNTTNYGSHLSVGKLQMVRTSGPVNLWYF